MSGLRNRSYRDADSYVRGNKSRGRWATKGMKARPEDSGDNSDVLAAVAPADVDYVTSSSSASGNGTGGGGGEKARRRRRRALDETRFGLMPRPYLVIHQLAEGRSEGMVLERTRPAYVILYAPDVEFVRRVEVHKVGLEAVSPVVVWWLPSVGWGEAVYFRGLFCCDEYVLEIERCTEVGGG